MKSKSKTLKQIFETGKVGAYNVRVVKTPRFLITHDNGQQFWLNGQTGLVGDSDDWLLNQFRQQLTHSDLGETFPFVAVDTVTLERECRKLHLALHEHDRTVYEGYLEAPMLVAHIKASDGESPQTAEQIAGLPLPNDDGRILINIQGSEECTEAGFDRVMRGNLAHVYFNSHTGAYRAIKTDVCKEMAAPLSGLALGDITTPDLVDAMLTAPEAEVYRA